MNLTRIEFLINEIDNSFHSQQINKSWHDGFQTSILFTKKDCTWHGTTNLDDMASLLYMLLAASVAY